MPRGNPGPFYNHNQTKKASKMIKHTEDPRHVGEALVAALEAQKAANHAAHEAKVAAIQAAMLHGWHHTLTLNVDRFMRMVNGR